MPLNKSITKLYTAKKKKKRTVGGRKENWIILQFCLARWLQRQNTRCKCKTYQLQQLEELTFSAPVASSITQFSRKQTHMASKSSAFSKRSDCFCAQQNGWSWMLNNHIEIIIAKSLTFTIDVKSSSRSSRSYILFFLNKEHVFLKKRIKNIPWEIDILPLVAPFDWWILLRVSELQESKIINKR